MKSDRQRIYSIPQNLPVVAQKAVASQINRGTIAQSTASDYYDPFEGHEDYEPEECADDSFSDELEDYLVDCESGIEAVPEGVSALDMRKLLSAGQRFADCDPNDPKKIKLFDERAIVFWKNVGLKEVSREHTQRAAALRPFLGSPVRRLKPVSQEAIELLESIRSDMPNFSEVVDFVSIEMRSAYMTFDRPFQLPPLLLAGPPGVGKTEFCRRLAAAVGVPFGSRVCTSASSPWLLQGLSFGYSGGHMGVVAQLLMAERFANPLIMLDEIEKAPKSSERGCLTDPLFELLEQRSAADFTDSYLERPINASFVNWVFTANDKTTIPEPLLQRMQVFEVSHPMPEQLPKLVRAIAAGLIDHFVQGGVLFIEPHEIPDSVVQSYAGLAPREMKRALKAAMSREVAGLYPTRSAAALQVPSCPANFSGAKSEPRSIGFHADIESI